jgi:hypothetical protein
MIVINLLSNDDIGDVSEQHPHLVLALSDMVIGVLFVEWLLLTVLRIVAFEPWDQ